MRVTLDISDEMIALLESKGVRIPEFVEDILAREAQTPPNPHRSAASAAVSRILERQKNFRLGVKIRDLIDEGRRN